MPACSKSSAAVCLLKARPSRLLKLWWIALHGLLGTAVLMADPAASLIAWPLLALHWSRRRPRETRGGCLLLADGRCSLPLEGRFNLALAEASRSGPGWLWLVFPDRPGAGLLLLRDQFDARAWRRLKLALRERS